jgi:hypothetical protein
LARHVISRTSSFVPFFDEITVEKPDRFESGTRTLHRHVPRSGRASHIRRAPLVRGALVLSLAPLLACGGRGNALPIDAGDTSRTCAGTTVCDGRFLRACTDGSVGDESEDCGVDGMCSLGRCTSSACATVERDKNGFVGCVFYTVEVNNVASDVGQATSFLVTNPGGEAAEVKLERHVGTIWSSAGTATIAAGAAARLPIAGLEIEMSGWSDGGLRLTASQPVTVAQIQSDDGNLRASSSGGTMLLPVQVLGRRHLVMTYSQKQTAAIAATTGSTGGAGRLLVVGTRARTEVILRVSTKASAVVTGSFPTLPAGREYPPFTLGEGEVFQAWSGGDDQDLSGTEISSSQPVAVFSGNITTTYGRTGIDVQSPDMVHEQMPPTAHWSYKYVAAALPPQANTCDTLLGQPGASLWRILAANDDTRVEFTSADPTRPIHDKTTMKAGEVIELMADVDFVVEASWPVLMTQGIDCEPSLSLAISADKLMEDEDVTFSVLPAFDQVAAIARMHNESVWLDGVAVEGALFAPAGAGYEVARVQLAACPPSKLVCTHRLQGRFGMTLRGMDVLASYALTAPSWRGCNDPLDCVN